MELMPEPQTEEQTVNEGMVPDVLHAEYSRLCTIAGDAQYRKLCLETELTNANRKIVEVVKLIQERDERRKTESEKVEAEMGALDVQN